MLLVAMLVLAALWFANPLGHIRVSPTGGPTSQATPVDPAEAASPTVPLTLPSTAG